MFFFSIESSCIDLYAIQPGLAGFHFCSFACFINSVSVGPVSAVVQELFCVPGFWVPGCVSGVVWLCVCVCVVMPLPVPEAPASRRLALDCRTILDHRVGKGGCDGWCVNPLAAFRPTDWLFFVQPWDQEYRGCLLSFHIMKMYLRYVIYLVNSF